MKSLLYGGLQAPRWTRDGSDLQLKFKSGGELVHVIIDRARNTWVRTCHDTFEAKQARSVCIVHIYHEDGELAPGELSESRSVREESPAACE